MVLLLALVLSAHPVDELDVTKPLDAKQLKKLEPDELRLLRNSIYARHGRSFEAVSLATFFASREWYQKDPAYADTRLTPVEKANVELIAKAEKARGGAWTETQYLEWLNQTLDGLLPSDAVLISPTPNGGWEVQLTCGQPGTRASISSSPQGSSLDEEYVEGGESVYAFVALLRDGKGRWLGLTADDPKRAVSIRTEGSHVLFETRRYASRSGLRTRETVSKEGCRLTGH